MPKDFDKWNYKKKELQKRGTTPFCYPREVWYIQDIKGVS